MKVASIKSLRGSVACGILEKRNDHLYGFEQKKPVYRYKLLCIVGDSSGILEFTPRGESAVDFMLQDHLFPFVHGSGFVSNRAHEGFS